MNRRAAAYNFAIVMDQITPSIIRFDSLGSTNTEAASWAMQGAPEGLCVVAREQTAGRGRLDRAWVSRKDAGLYLSVVLRPSLQQRSLPLITLMTSLAVRDALIESCDLYTDIKWPNDLVANGAKLSGILAEVLETSIGRAVVVGVGINLTNQSLSEELHGVATSVETATGKIPDSEHVLQAVISKLAHRYEALQAENGAETTVAEWCFASSFAENKKIRVNSGEEILEGITRGLEPDGALRIETAPGEIRVIRAGDVFELRDRGASI